MRRLVILMVMGVVSGVPLVAAELQAQTVTAFNRYVRATEERLTGEPFLWIDGLPTARRMKALRLLRSGARSIEPLRSVEGNQEIGVPGGQIHHWVGTAFVPRASITQALAILQDYDRHARIYAPVVARSKLLRRDGGRFQFFLRFTMKKVITVVVNSDHEAVFTRRGLDRAEGWIRSTRIAQIENADEPGERELPVGRDGGYLWRLNTYWRLLERDGGVYIQCESVSLTRNIPVGFAWLVTPFVTSIPRESLTFTLETTQDQLMRAS